MTQVIKALEIMFDKDRITESVHSFITTITTGAMVLLPIIGFIFPNLGIDSDFVNSISESLTTVNILLWEFVGGAIVLINKFIANFGKNATDQRIERIVEARLAERANLKN